MLSPKEKKVLRSLGQQLKPELWIGKEGISPGTIQSLENSFTTKDLVKIKLQESCPQDKQAIAGTLSNECGAELVQIIGNTILLYRVLPETEKPAKTKKTTK